MAYEQTELETAHRQTWDTTKVLDQKKMLPEGSAKQSEKGLWGRVLEYDLQALKKEKETCTEQSQDAFCT